MNLFLAFAILKLHLEHSAVQKAFAVLMLQLKPSACNLTNSWRTVVRSGTYEAADAGYGA